MQYRLFMHSSRLFMCAMLLPAQPGDAADAPGQAAMAGNMASSLQLYKDIDGGGKESKEGEREVRERGRRWRRGWGIGGSTGAAVACGWGSAAFYVSAPVKGPPRRSPLLSPHLVPALCVKCYRIRRLGRLLSRGTFRVRHTTRPFFRRFPSPDPFFLNYLGNPLLVWEQDTLIIYFFPQRAVFLFLVI